MPDRVIVGISGSSGVILGLRLLKVLKELHCESHLIVTDAAKTVMGHEAPHGPREIAQAGCICHDNGDLMAPVASGSFRTRGMAVIPCSMKTLAGIACGYADNLLLRAADVCLKERRKLILVVRETPLNLIHIENMRRVALAGGIILPAALTMYIKPSGIEDIVDHIVGKVLDVLGIENDIYRRWGEQ